MHHSARSQENHPREGEAEAKNSRTKLLKVIAVRNTAIVCSAMTTPAHSGADSRRAILKTEGIDDASKADAHGIALGIEHSLKNHEGKGVEVVSEARPAKWMPRKNGDAKRH